MSVRWGDTISTQFTVANGVKQGGVISPNLFNVYMDDLSTALNSSGIGGYLRRIPRELSKIRTQPWLSEGSLTCNPCHHRGPIF